ncbi:MAG: hypothetical protein A2W93_00045 [Bacteroidetes bacterium GWF2_43_63]|nr:MAG: hypothetical protein A2W94_07265 [Bacteroidetes bacterium GWE2_42_42]OFY54728.1 MAG: hypothetical protein A2W93_00045 [Bacteroidetes bacterium GWF2_43_63]HBG69203.1 phospholipase [Bacteroidales bacterium]HCB62526.1 phospholipase [Bacteroidales bacterium]
MKPALILLFSLILFSSANKVDAQDHWKSLMLSAKFTTNQGVLPYRMYVPDSIGPDEKLPFVLFLHGAGERGDDNESQLFNGVRHFMNDSIRQQFRCIILAPQCPLSARWVEVDWSKPSHRMPPRISVPLGQTFSLIDSLIEILPVDTSRIYVTGLSMGGFGTWDALARRPDFFAAGMPVCGGGDETSACLMENIPVKAFHGKLDHLVIPSRTANMVNAVNQCGGLAEFVLFPNLGHLCWEQVYSNVENIRWLFLQKRDK